MLNWEVSFFCSLRTMPFPVFLHLVAFETIQRISRQFSHFLYLQNNTVSELMQLLTTVLEKLGQEFVLLSELVVLKSFLTLSVIVDWHFFCSSSVPTVQQYVSRSALSTWKPPLFYLSASFHRGCCPCWDMAIFFFARHWQFRKISAYHSVQQYLEMFSPLGSHHYCFICQQVSITGEGTVLPRTPFFVS